MNDDMLHAYLQHHWAGASAGAAMFERVGRSHSDTDVAARVRRLATEVKEDREQLRQIIMATGATPSRIAATTGRAVEFAGRFKPNGRLVRRSPLSDLFELEALRDAVTAKRAGGSCCVPPPRTTPVSTRCSWTSSSAAPATRSPGSRTCTCGWDVR
jgi:hypothetical protein